MVEDRLWNKASSSWGGEGFGDTHVNSLPYLQGIFQDNRARLFHSLSHSQMFEVTMTKHSSLSRYCSLMQEDMLQTDSFLISWVEFPSLLVVLMV